MKRILKSKRSQVTIFIIAGILIVTLILFFFLIRNKISIPGIHTKLPDFSSEIEKCVSDNVLKAVNIILPQAGYINPDNYKLYQDNKVEYLCYNKNFYQTCVNQEPLYIEHLSSEIKTYISPKLEDCFYSIKQEFEAQGYSVNMDNTNLNVVLNPKQVNVIIDKNILINKNQESKKYDKLRFTISSPIYDLGIIATKIVADEAKYCYFESLGNDLLYPDYLIEKTNVGNDETSSKIYSITDKFSKKTLIIAIRGCALPGGLR